MRVEKYGAFGQVFLPGKLKFKLRDGDRAVYIGTMRYHRDVYNGITKVELINEYDQDIDRVSEEIRQFAEGAASNTHPIMEKGFTPGVLP